MSVEVESADSEGRKIVSEHPQQQTPLPRPLMLESNLVRQRRTIQDIRKSMSRGDWSDTGALISRGMEFTNPECVREFTGIIRDLGAEHGDVVRDFVTRVKISGSSADSVDSALEYVQAVNELKLGVLGTAVHNVSLHASDSAGMRSALNYLNIVSDMSSGLVHTVVGNVGLAPTDDETRYLAGRYVARARDLNPDLLETALRHVEFGREDDATNLWLAGLREDLNNVDLWRERFTLDDVRGRFGGRTADGLREEIRGSGRDPGEVCIMVTGRPAEHFMGSRRIRHIIEVCDEPWLPPVFSYIEKIPSNSWEADAQRFGDGLDSEGQPRNIGAGSLDIVYDEGNVRNRRIIERALPNETALAELRNATPALTRSDFEDFGRSWAEHLHEMVSEGRMIYDLSHIPGTHVRWFGGEVRFLDFNNMVNLTELNSRVGELNRVKCHQRDAVSIYVPGGYGLNDIVSHLDDERESVMDSGSDSYIRNEPTRGGVVACIDAIKERVLSPGFDMPQHGMALFAYNVVSRQGVQDTIVSEVDMPYPLLRWEFTHDRRFNTKPIEEDTLIKVHIKNAKRLFHEHIPWAYNGLAWNAFISRLRELGGETGFEGFFRGVVGWVSRQENRYTKLLGEIEYEETHTTPVGSPVRSTYDLHSERFFRKGRLEEVQRRRGESEYETRVHNYTEDIAAQLAPLRMLYAEDFGETIARDMIDTLPEYRDLDVDVEAGPREHGQETVVVRVRRGDPWRDTIRMYRIRPVSREEFDNLVQMSAAGVGMRVIAARRHGNGEVIRDHLIEEYHDPGLYSVERRRDLPQMLCERLGEKTADVFARVVHQGIAPADYGESFTVDEINDGREVHVRFRNCVRENLRGNDDRLKGHFRRIAEAFAGLNHGAVAWGVFEDTLPHAAVLEMPDESGERYTRLLEEVKSELSGAGRSELTPEQQRWGQFFRRAGSVSWAKRDVREKQREFLGYLESSEHPPTTRYGQENLAALRALEPLIVRGIGSLMENGFRMEDVVADVTQIHVCIPDGIEKAVDAKIGRLGNITEGAIVYDLYRHELDKPRFQEYANQRVIIRFKDGVLGEPEVVPVRDPLLLPFDEELRSRNLINLAAFVAYPREGNRYVVGYDGETQGFDLWWDPKYFLSRGPGAKRSLEARSVSEWESELEVESSWGRALHTASRNYENWQDIMSGCRSILSRIDEEHRDSFIRVLPRILDPYDEKLLDGETPYLDFGFYRHLPGVLEKKIHVSYPDLGRYTARLFTMERRFEAVRPYVQEHHVYPHEDEFRKILAEQGIGEVALASDNPEDYIQGIEFQRNARHYVIKMKFKLGDDSTDDAIVKVSPYMWEEYYMSNFYRAFGIDAPIIFPVGKKYGVETLAPGRRFLDNRDVVDEFSSDSVRWLARNYCVGALDGSARNYMVDRQADAGGAARPVFTRIDCELIDELSRAAGVHGTLYELGTVEDTVATWRDNPHRRLELFNEMMGEIPVMQDTVINHTEPSGRRVNQEAAFAILDTAVADPNIAGDPRRRLTPDYVSRLKGMVLMSPDAKQRDLIFWRARAEENRLHDHISEPPTTLYEPDPMYHMIHIDRVMDDIAGGNDLYDIRRLVGDRTAFPLALGMYTRLAGILALEGDVVGYADRSGNPVPANLRDLPYYAAGREMALLQGYVTHTRDTLSNLAGGGIPREQLIERKESILEIFLDDRYWDLYQRDGYYQPGVKFRDALRSFGPHDTGRCMKRQLSDPDLARLRELFPGDSTLLEMASGDMADFKRFDIARRIILPARDAVDHPERMRAIPAELREEYEDRSSMELNMREFRRGFLMMDAWLKENKWRVMGYAGHALQTDGAGMTKFLGGIQVNDDEFRARMGEIDAMISEDPDRILDEVGGWLASGGIRDGVGGIAMLTDETKVRVRRPLRGEYTHGIPQFILEAADHLDTDVNKTARHYDQLQSFIESMPDRDFREKFTRVVDEIRFSREAHGVHRYSALLEAMAILDSTRMSGVDRFTRVLDSLYSEATKPDSERYFWSDVPGRTIREMRDRLITYVHDFRENTGGGDVAQ